MFYDDSIDSQMIQWHAVAAARIAAAATEPWLDFCDRTSRLGSVERLAAEQARTAAQRQHTGSL